MLISDILATIAGIESMDVVMVVC